MAQSTQHTPLTFSRGAGSGAPLRAHTVGGFLSNGGRCCRLPHTLTDIISSSGSAAILSSVAPCGDGSSVAAGSGSPSAVGSGMRSVQRGDGGLGTGSGVELARFSWEQVGNGDPFLASVHSTKAEKVGRRPSSDNTALHAMFKLAS